MLNTATFWKQVTARFAVIATCLALATGLAIFYKGGVSPQVVNAATGNWIAAWEASVTAGDTLNPSACPASAGLSSQTIRNIVFISTGGTQVRARISNLGGNTPLQVGGASIALAGSGANTTGTLHKLTFGGQATTVISAGSEVVSDPVSITVKALQTLAVSIYLPGMTGPATEHYYAQQNNYLAIGNQSQATSGSSFNQTISCWMFLSGVDVYAPSNVYGSVVAFGDSITDGHYSTTNANHRYPDYVARVLAARTGVTYSIVNAGLSGNELLNSRNMLLFGEPGVDRFAHDVLAEAGVSAVILLEGVNDIGVNSTPATTLESADEQLIAEAHAAGLAIFGGTLIPFGGSNQYYGGDYGTTNGEQIRTALNTWIRTSGAFDAVIDFDQAVRDPNNPTQLLAAYDSGDHLHPNDAGYQAMANAIPISSLIGN